MSVPILPSGGDLDYSPFLGASCQNEKNTFLFPHLCMQSTSRANTNSLGDRSLGQSDY